jgi:hypothetical protein
MTVPADDAKLLAEFRRHGVRPGSRLHVIVSEDAAAEKEEPLPVLRQLYRTT